MMSKTSKTIDILTHMQGYCLDIEETVQRYGDLSVLRVDKDFRNSICMSLLQIGELAGHLPDDFRKSTQSIINWPQVRGMRNVMAHNYGGLNMKQVWDAVKNDIPVLKKFCENRIELYKTWEAKLTAHSPVRTI